MSIPIDTTFRATLFMCASAGAGRRAHKIVDASSQHSLGWLLRDAFAFGQPVGVTIEKKEPAWYMSVSIH